MNRREFIKMTGGGAAAAALGPHVVMGQVGAADRVRVGVLGSGARAQGLMVEAMRIPSVEIVAVCDAYRGRAERARALTENRAQIFDDYRRILDLPEVDAVFIGSPDHWHRQMSLDALSAGKDVYIEKPMTYAIDEGTEILGAVGNTSRIYQVGSQGMSSATQRLARDLVGQERLGQVTLIRASYNRNTASGAWLYPLPPDAGPETVNWEQFLGPAPRRPFDLERFFRWRCYWDYSGGIATDLFVHLVTSIHFIMGAKMPESVMASGQLYRWKDSRDVPDTLNAILVYPEGFTVNLSSTFNNQASAESGFEILGTGGTLAFRGGKMSFSPENAYEDNRWVVESWTEELARQYYEDPKVQARETPETWVAQMKPAGETWEEWGQGATLRHLSSFFGSVRSRKPPVQDALMGHRAAACAHLINLSLRQEKTVHWDFERENVRT
jgi:predicted dehydrogenase